MHLKNDLRVVKFVLGFVALFICFCASYAQPIQWRSSGIGGGGAMFSPSMNPYNAQDMYIACDMSDLFHSKDRGYHWKMIDFRQVASSRETKVCFTSQPNLVYTIRYNNYNANPAKSTDSGATWQTLSGWKGTAYEMFSDIYDSLRLIVSDYDNIYFTKDGGKSFKKIYHLVVLSLIVHGFILLPNRGF